MKRLTADDYNVSTWSGGTTTQLAIFPPEAVYADRDFLWRVSSATVDLEESDFTALPDYDRLIATLRGEIVLTHNGGAPLTLRPYEVHAFSGGDPQRGPLHGLQSDAPPGPRHRHYGGPAPRRVGPNLPCQGEGERRERRGGGVPPARGRRFPRLSF